MSLNINYKRKLFIYYFSIFFIITSAFVVYQYDREKQFRVNQLESSLNTVTRLTNNYIKENGLIGTEQINKIDSLSRIIPFEDTRITVIDPKGKVLYDSFVKDYESMENHLQRPEVQKAKYASEGIGANIRHSATTGQDFYYYAHDFNDYFVRAAMVYNVEVKNFLKAERVFLIFIAFIFVVMWIILSVVTKKMSESITKLRDFAVQLRSNDKLDSNIDFPQNELGVIGKQIVSMYKRLNEAKNALSLEKEKLIKHLYVLNEGVGFFSSEKKSVLTNTHFVQFLNLIAEKSSIHPEHIFKIDDLKDLKKFIKKYCDNDDYTINSNDLPQFEMTLQKSSYYFQIKCVIFQDRSFEILINDVTKLEKRRLLKQQMTSNIAHELKTPVASVRGYLETILNNTNIEEEKKNYFIDKAYQQSNRLSDLIEDIVVLNKIEEANYQFEMEQVNAREVIDEVLESREGLISYQKAEIEVNVSHIIKVEGNRSLIVSIFQNLIDNSLNYGGDNIKIKIDMYHNDDEFYYFSVCDNGVGIPEKHLSRIFERFYRVDSGRSRKLGGTGLGLAIVKHAVNTHKGEVSVKNNPNGGAEFYFNLPKA